MKRCPQCYQPYQDTEMFCEKDGRQLLTVPGIVVAGADLVAETPVRKSNPNAIAIGVGGMFIGALLCGGAYVAYSVLQSGTDRDDRAHAKLETQTRESSQPRQALLRPVEALAEPSASPTPEEEEAEASPEPAPPEADNTVSARLERGPVSTGAPPSQRGDDTKLRTIIEMQDGSVVEVDAAWKDAQGVWYRRGGLVSFVESPRVKAITARAAESKESPVDNK